MLLARTSTEDDASKTATHRAEPKANDVRMLENVVAWNFGNRIRHGLLVRVVVRWTGALAARQTIGALQGRIANWSMK